METYVVQEGDTIISIAKLFGVRIVDILSANNLEDNPVIEPGMSLIIPLDRPTAFGAYVVQSGDTLYSIAKKHDIDVETLAAINGLKPGEYIYINQRILVPKEGVKAYITKMGDTLSTVSSTLDTSIKELMIYNEQIYLLPEQLIAYREVNKEK